MSDTTKRTTRIEPALLALGDAVALLHAGEVVAFPTETVYGLGADARRNDAVGRIYAAKGRPPGNPVIVHVAEVADARACAAGWPEHAEVLAQKFWPGPLTVIVERGKGLSPLVSAGRSTVALRCPGHPVAEALLRAFDGPLAAPSANRSGFTSPTTASHVMAELDGRIPLVLDGGECQVGVESTVVDLSSKVPVILRPGAITAEMLRDAIGEVRMTDATVNARDSAASPGQHARHYAPHTPAYRFDSADWEKGAHAWAGAYGPVALLTWSNDMTLPAPHHTLRLPAADGDYARVVYAALRDADALGVKAILVLMPPAERTATGLWTAVADRLRRATQPLSTVLSA